MIQLCGQEFTREVNPLSGKNDATVLRNILEENYKKHLTLRNCSEDRFSRAHEYVMQLLEASSVYRDEIIENHRGGLGRPRYHVETKELQQNLSISTIPLQKLHQYVSEETVLKEITLSLHNSSTMGLKTLLAAYVANKIFTSNFANSIKKLSTTKSESKIAFLIYTKKC